MRTGNALEIGIILFIQSNENFEELKDLGITTNEEFEEYESTMTILIGDISYFYVNHKGHTIIGLRNGEKFVSTESYKTIRSALATSKLTEYDDEDYQTR